MKLVHNKKRNTLFLYESLIREYTKASLEKNNKKITEIKNLLSEYFQDGKILKEELKLYKAVLNTENTEKDLAEKILSEAKRIYVGLNQQSVFQQQSSLIAKVNRSLTSKFFSNYVPNYKDIASVQQIFAQKTDIPSRMLLEKQIVERMISKKETLEELNGKVDKYVIHSYLNSFNKKYSGLLENQKTLLKKYMISSDDDNTDFIVFLNEELHNISNKLSNAHNIAEIKDDKIMMNKLSEVKKIFNLIKKEDVTDNLLQKVLKYQKLAQELEN